MLPVEKEKGLEARRPASIFMVKTEPLSTNPDQREGANFSLREINVTEKLKKKLMKPNIGSLKEINKFLTTSIKKNVKRGKHKLPK